MKHMSKDMQACIDECLRCYQTCLGTAMTPCLETGGKHVEPKPFRLMMACSEICRTAAHFMLLNTSAANVRKSALNVQRIVSASATWTTVSRPARAAPRVAVRWEVNCYNADGRSVEGTWPAAVLTRTCVRCRRG